MSAAALAGCSSLLHQPERADVVPKGAFAVGATASTEARFEPAKQNFPPSNDLNLGVTGALDAAYGAIEGLEIDASGSYLGQSFGGAGSVRYRWLEAMNGRLTSVASAGGFAGQYQASDFTYYPSLQTPFYSVNSVTATAVGGQIASSTGYKIADAISLYAGPKFYFLNLNATYNGFPNVAQTYSWSGLAYEGFVGAAFTLPLTKSMEAVVDLMGTGALVPANVRSGNLIFVPGAALTLLLQFRRERSEPLDSAVPARPETRPAARPSYDDPNLATRPFSKRTEVLPPPTSAPNTPPATEGPTIIMKPAKKRR